ncbi:MAG TPA: AAA family ATPase [Caulobacteraceae bacterium]|jgi:chromosome partitioning protein|nr:AAA family ATPase [Caulobacteraceae bacterium]
MRTIAVIALKGGSGKTTVASHIALAAHLRGLKTLVADSDPQRSASEVFKAREAEGPTCVAAMGQSLFAAQIAGVGAGMDVMVVDTAAGAVEDVTQAIVVADHALLVVRPTLMDIAAAVRTIDVIRRLRKPALVVVNQAPASREGVEPPSVKRALRAIEVMRLPIVPTLLRARSIYQSALETGRSAEECYDVNAAGEIAALWAFIERFTFGKRKGTKTETDGENEDEDLKFAP